MPYPCRNACACSYHGDDGDGRACHGACHDGASCDHGGPFSRVCDGDDTSEGCDHDDGDDGYDCVDHDGGSDGDHDVYDREGQSHQIDR